MVDTTVDLTMLNFKCSKNFNNLNLKNFKDFKCSLNLKIFKCSLIEQH